MRVLGRKWITIRIETHRRAKTFTPLSRGKIPRNKNFSKFYKRKKSCLEINLDQTKKPECFLHNRVFYERQRIEVSKNIYCLPTKIKKFNAEQSAIEKNDFDKQTCMFILNDSLCEKTEKNIERNSFNLIYKNRYKKKMINRQPKITIHYRNGEFETFNLYAINKKVLFNKLIYAGFRLYHFCENIL